MSSVRDCGAERSLKLLSLEDFSSHKLPSVSDIDLHHLCDMFVIKSPRTLTADSLQSVCQASYKMLHISTICMHKH